MVHGYARVSTKGQARDGNSLEHQKEELVQAGANPEAIYYESYTGTQKHRPELDKLLSSLRRGDTVIVCKIDRIARNTKDGIEIIDTIIGKGCGIKILNMGTFDDTATGRLTRTIMLAFAEWERDQIYERTQAGKEIARQRPDFKEGRPRKVDNETLKNFLRRQKGGELTVAECCNRLGICKATWYNLIKEVVI